MIINCFKVTGESVERVLRLKAGCRDLEVCWWVICEICCKRYLIKRRDLW